MNEETQGSEKLRDLFLATQLKKLKNSQDPGLLTFIVFSSLHLRVFLFQLPRFPREELCLSQGVKASPYSTQEHSQPGHHFGPPDARFSVGPSMSSSRVSKNFLPKLNGVKYAR